MRLSKITLLMSLFTGIGISPFCFGAGTPSITGNLPRGSFTSFTFTVTVGSLKTAEAGIGSSDDMVKDRLKVYFSTASASDILPVNDCGTSAFKVESLNGLSPTGSDPTYSITYTLKISECSGRMSSYYTSGNTPSFNVRVKFLPSKGSTTETDSLDKALTAVLAVPKDAPTLNSISSVDSGIVAKYTASTTPAFNNGQSYQVSTLSVLVFDLSVVASGTYLPTKILSSSTATQDTTATGSQQCQFSISTSCISCPTTNSYIDTSALSIDGIIKETSSTSSSLQLVRGLKNGNSYLVSAIYESGTTASSCIYATPKKTYSLAENLGEQETQESDARCFIATAAYGNPHHPNLELFRWFRDRILMLTPNGKKFVEWYYTVSPYYANKLAQSSTLSKTVATLLWGPAVVIMVLKLLLLNPRYLGFLLLTVLVGIKFYRQKKLWRTY